MKNGKAWVCSKNKNLERVNNSCYMKMGYLCEAQPSLILDASQIGHFHGIMWEQHTLEVTDRGFLSKVSLAFFKSLISTLPLSTFHQLSSIHRINLKIFHRPWNYCTQLGFSFSGPVLSSCPKLSFYERKIKCSSELNKVRSRWWLSIPYLLHQCALTVIPLWTIGVFQSKLLFQLDFDWRFSCWFVRIKVLVKTGDITFKMWLNEQGRT